LNFVIETLVSSPPTDPAMLYRLLVVAGSLLAEDSGDGDVPLHEIATGLGLDAQALQWASHADANVVAVAKELSSVLAPK
jgi:hypothetical protein